MRAGAHACFPHDSVHNIIIGSNTIALKAASLECSKASVLPVMLTSALDGEAYKVNMRTRLFHSGLIGMAGLCSTFQLKKLANYFGVHILPPPLCWLDKMGIAMS